MNRYESGPDTGHSSGDDLRRVLHDTVDSIEPRPGLDAIRARTADQASGTGRAWLLGAFGAAVATAAVVAGIAVAGNDPRPAADAPPAGHSTPSDGASDAPSGGPSDGASDGSDGASDGATDGSTDGSTGETVAAGIYFAGDTPQGVSLYREFQRVDAGDRLRAAANLALRGDPADPDYRTLWPEGAAIESVSFDGVDEDGLIQVSLPDAALHERPATMTPREAELAIEQVVYTLQGVVAARAPVQFLLDGNPTDTVLGVPTSEAIANGDPLAVLAHVNITAPEQGEEVGALVATGVASSYEGTVPLKVLRGAEVVLEGFANAAGFEGKLYPWSTTLDISALPPGDYTLVASTDDPSGGAEGAGPHTDTKDFTIP